MQLKFWGTRGSIPRPYSFKVATEETLDFLNWAKKQNITSVDQLIEFHKKSLSLIDKPNKIEYQSPHLFGGETTCIEVRNDDDFFIVDAGSGIRQLGESYKDHSTFNIFLTHMHWDHILGLPFFAPIYLANKQINIYHIHDNTEDFIEVLFNGVNFPVRWNELKAKIKFIKIKPYEAYVHKSFSITPFSMDHPGKAYGFRVESSEYKAAICTDSSFERLNPTELGEDKSYYQGLDAIVFDGQFDAKDYQLKQAFGHSTPERGLTLASREKIPYLILTHHDPYYSNQKILSLFLETCDLAKTYEFKPNVLSAFDGMIFDLRTQRR